MKTSVFLRQSIACLIGFLTTTGAFLSAHADGLPGEYLGTQRWRDLLARHSSLVNPAFMSQEDFISVRACQAFNLGSAFNLTETGITVPISLRRTLGCTYASQGANGSLAQTQWNSTGGGIDTVGYTSNRHNLVILSYADNFSGPFTFGVNIGYSYQSNFGTPRSGISGDIGLSCRLPLAERLGEHLLGLSLQNIAQPITALLPASDQFTAESYSNNVKLSWNAYFNRRSIDCGIDLDLKNVYASIVKLKESGRKGSIEFDAALRLGGRLFNIIDVYSLFGTEYVGGSAGIHVPLGDQGHDVVFHYQYMALARTQGAPAQSMYLQMNIGPNRQDLAAKRKAAQLALAPYELYNKAMRLYSGAKYWDAYFIFSQIIIEYPQFPKNDRCSYLRGSCMESIDMRELASSYYEETLERFPQSTVGPLVDLGLLRLDYREDKPAAIIAQFNKIASSPAPDSIKYHADYLMGQTYLKQQKYTSASALFSRIPDSHPDYLFAQHSLAISTLLEDKKDDALQILNTCVDAKAQTDEEKRIVERSFLFLGYIFFENLELPKAISALRSIPANSYYYEDALLGMCWTALKARQWAGCIEYGQTLQKASAKVPLRCEGMLLQGYAYMMQKNYTAAYTVLNEAEALAKELQTPSPDSIDAARQQYKTDRLAYDETGNAAERLAKAFSKPNTLDSINSLRTVQVAGKARIDQFLVFNDEFARLGLFSRNIETLKSDLAYTLAIVQKRSAESPVREVQEKLQEKDSKINEQIEVLKKELEQLNNK
jgi:TolA-binding protein